jgi:hypothetical protein
MTTLAVDAPMQKVQGFLGSIPIVANDIVYEGAMVGENGAGYGRPLTAGDKFVGHCITKVDNTLSGPLAKAGAAGDLNIRLMVGRYRLIVALAGYITDVGQPVYASDDATLTFDAAGNSFVGIVTRYVSSTQLEVEFMPGEKDEWGNANRVKKTDDANAAATESGYVIYLGVDGKTITLPATSVGLEYIVVNWAPAGTAGIAVDFQAADKNLGGCGVSAGGDGYKLTNTKATAKRGDFMHFAADGTHGYYIKAYRGTWAQES